MSGIEVAGLVLGALPILISALEGYSKGLQPLKTFFKGHKPQLMALIRCLKHQKFLFRQNMRRLLLAAAPIEEHDLAKSEDVLTFMGRDDITKSVEQYLADDHSLDFFADILDEYKKYLEAIAGHLMGVSVHQGE
jgi:hypothetical protein